MINKTLHDGANIGGEENYVILEAEGHGNIAGFFLHIDNFAGRWYGEGDDMIFIDGEEWPPSIHGTGSEEIFGGGACPSTEYIGPYQGYLYAANKNFAGKVSLYRFYAPDPIRFTKSVRMTIEHGHANNYENDYSSTVFWYQNEPHAAFPALPPAGQRYPRKGDDPHEQACEAYATIRKQFTDLRSKSKEITGAPQPFDEIQESVDDLAEAMQARRNLKVLKLSEGISKEIDAAKKELDNS